MSRIQFEDWLPSPSCNHCGVNAKRYILWKPVYYMAISSELKYRKVLVGSEEISEMVQNKLFELGCKWYDESGVRHRTSPALYINGDGFLTHSALDYYFRNSEHKELGVFELMQMKPNRTITIDGKEIKISEDSYQELKKALV